MKPAVHSENETEAGLFDAVFNQDSMGVAVRTIGPGDSRWLRVNQKFCDLLGYTREELLQLRSVDIFPPEDRNQLIEDENRLLREELNGRSHEMRYLRKDGSEIWTNTSLSVVPDPDGNPAKIISVVQDITRQKMAEDAEALLSKVYQSSPALFTVSSPREGRHFNVNDAWSSITGYSREEALQNTVRGVDIWAIPEDRKKFVAMIKDQGSVRNFETVYRTKNGAEKNMLISGEAIDFRGEDCLLVVGQDVTEEKQAQKALKEAHDELEQFAYSISHDLKSPLVTVNSFVGLLARDLEAGDDESVAKDMQHIESAVSKMGRSIDDLLELSRIGRAASKPQEFSLNQLVDEVVGILQGSITDSAVEIDIATDVPAVLADKQQIREVMQNLLENSIKFCKDIDDPKISIDAEIEDNWVRCWVKDNGIGIDPRYHNKVFGLFDRLDPNIDGTGVGLALVKRIIEIHDGKVWIESEGIGQGTKVVFTLPAAGGARASS